MNVDTMSGRRLRIRRPNVWTTMRSVAICVGVLISLVLPPLLNYSGRNIYLTICFSVIVVTGLALLVGYAGQLSLGQAAFYAIGAYGAALAATHGVPTVLALVGAPVVAALVALIVGAPIMKLKGHYLAFATIALQLIVIAVLRVSPATGGDIGIVGIPSLSIAGLEISDLPFIYLTLAVVFAILVISRNLISSGPGRGLRALADNETIARSTGVPVTRYKMVVFCLSAAYAGLAGGLMTFYYGAISPDSFSVLLSFQFVIMAIVGGLGTIMGPIVGVVLITLLTQVLNALGSLPGLPESMPSVLTYLVYGLLLAVVISFLPGGIWTLFSQWLRRRAETNRVETRSVTDWGANEAG